MDADPVESRLTTLEEHAAFAERTADQLSVEIAELNKRLHAMNARVIALEDTLRRALNPPTNAPPTA